MDRNNSLAYVYKMCMNAVHDTEYCATLVEILLEVSTKRVFSYVPEGRPKPRFHLVLPSDVDYMANIMVDKTKKSVIIMLVAPHHAVALIYERGKDGNATLKSATVSSVEVAALMNGPFRLNEKSEVGGL